MNPFSDPLQKREARRHYRKGLLFHKDGKFAEAKGEYENAVENDPGCWKGYTNLGKVIIDMISSDDTDISAKLDDAERYFTKSLDIRPERAIPLFDLGTISYMYRDEKDVAYDYFARAFNCDPEFGILVENYLNLWSNSSKEEFTKVIAQSINLISGESMKKQARADIPDDITAVSPVEYIPYTSRKYGFSIRIPVGFADHTENAEKPESFEVLFDIHNYDGTRIGFIAGPHDDGKAAGVQQLETQAARHVENLGGALLSLTRTDIDGIAGVEAVYTVSLMKTKKFAFIRDGREYLITCAAHPQLYDRYEPVFDDVVRSLSFYPA
jgi:tetratricopeptide (TPR) repeat protein